MELVDNVIALDVEWRKRNFELEQCRKDVGAQQKAVAELKKAGAAKAAEADAAVAAMGALKARIPVLEEGVDAIKAQLERELNKVPNEVDASVPVSKDEEHNVVVRQWGACETREGLLHHHELLAMIDGYEPERGVGVAGHRAYFLKGFGVLLNQALINYGLSFLLRRAYTPMQPPFFMNKEAMAGIAQLEDFDEQLYKVHCGSGEKTPAALKAANPAAALPPLVATPPGPRAPVPPLNSAPSAGPALPPPARAPTNASSSQPTPPPTSTVVAPAPAPAPVATANRLDADAIAALASEVANETIEPPVVAALTRAAAEAAVLAARLTQDVVAQVGLWAGPDESRTRKLGC